MGEIRGNGDVRAIHLFVDGFLRGFSKGRTVTLLTLRSRRLLRRVHCTRFQRFKRDDEEEVHLKLLIFSIRLTSNTNAFCISAHEYLSARNVNNFFVCFE